MELELQQARYGDVDLLVVSGRLDQDTAEDFQAKLESTIAESASEQPCLVLDFSGVEYISSVGLRALMIASRACRAKSGRLSMASLQPMVQEVFQISRFDKVIDTYADVPAALTALSPEAAEAYGRA